MPKSKSKKFIDKKNSVTFHLVHRSQKDPLSADENAPQGVLVQAQSSQAAKFEKKTATKDPNEEQEFRKRKEEEQKYGIYFEDEYNYLQHLKDVNKLPLEWEKVDNQNDKKKNKDNMSKIKHPSFLMESQDDNEDNEEEEEEREEEVSRIMIPASAFASSVEEEVGLLNRAAPISGPRVDLDPDIVAAMDDDFAYDDPENQLEENFMELLNAEDSEIEFDERDEDEYDDEDSDLSSGVMEFSDEERDEVCSLNGPQYTFRNEETKSNFTEYSMSSSVIRRNKELGLLDGRFEKFYDKFAENEIGSLECEEIEGEIDPNSKRLLQLAEEFEEEQNEVAESVAKLMKDRLKLIERDQSSSDEDNLQELAVEPRERDTWDCESYLSTYSNIYNHPKLISEPKGLGKIRIDPRTGVPKDVLDGRPGKLTAKGLAQLDMEYQLAKGKTGAPQSVAETMRSTLSTLSIRPKDELPEERKERKKALKEYRKERRIERKANAEAFKEEKKRQEKIMLNNKKNVQGNRIL